MWILILIEYKKADKKDIFFEFVNADTILNTKRELKKKISAIIP